MDAVRTAPVRLLSTRSIPSRATPEPIRFISTRSAMRCADKRVRLSVTFDPDGLFSRDSDKDSVPPWLLSQAAGRGSPNNCYCA